MIADVVVGLQFGDEGKGKVTHQLARNGNYTHVVRFNGGCNAGHTIYHEGKKFVTHHIPAGVFYGIRSIIGPGCVVNYKSFMQEIHYLQENGFDTTLVKISPYTHVITDAHIEEDIKKYSQSLGTTGNGIGPCYRDKYLRIGKRVKDFMDEFKDFIWDEHLYGNVLCEGAQGFWLDIDYGNYPYVTSSSTLPYGACSLGFSPKKIRHIYGATKIYDTRVGYDPDFSDELLKNEELNNIGIIGKEFGTTTGRRRIVNYLNLDKLIQAINMSGTTHLIMSKIDIVCEVGVFKYYFQGILHECSDIQCMKSCLANIIRRYTSITDIVFSSKPTEI